MKLSIKSIASNQINLIVFCLFFLILSSCSKDAQQDVVPEIVPGTTPENPISLETAEDAFHVWIIVKEMCNGINGNLPYVGDLSTGFDGSVQGSVAISGRKTESVNDGDYTYYSSRSSILDISFNDFIPYEGIYLNGLFEYYDSFRYNSSCDYNFNCADSTKIEKEIKGNQIEILFQNTDGLWVKDVIQLNFSIAFRGLEWSGTIVNQAGLSFRIQE